MNTDNHIVQLKLKKAKALFAEVDVQIQNEFSIPPSTGFITLASLQLMRCC